MAKNNKDKPISASVKQKPVLEKTDSLILRWSKSILYGFLGAGLYFFFNHILVFSPSPQSGSNLFFSIFCGVLAFVCSTSVFQKYIDKITWVSLGLIFLQVLASVALTYSWIGVNAITIFLSANLAIPIGILWYFILKNIVKSESDPSVFIFPFKSIWQDNLLRIVSVIVFFICGVLIFYRLGFYDIWEDENLVINAAIGIQQHGLEYLKEGYDRVWVHSLLISWVFDLFGVSEFTGRLPSAIFGLLFVVICYYVFTRWYGKGMIAVIIPIVCLMNDRFLILFRYMRMYALLIPLFLLAAYIIYRTITIKNQAVYFRGKKIAVLNTKILYVIGSLVMLLLLAHLQKLAAIILPVFLILILILAIYYRTKELIYISLIAIGGIALIAFLSFGLELYSFRMFRQLGSAIFRPHSFYGEYYHYMLDNALPINSTMMTLIAGLGVLRSRAETSIKSIIGISYLLIVIALVSMIYLIASEGQDYRYIAHIVPFVVGIILFVWYQSGKLISAKFCNWMLLLVLLISSLSLKEDYKRVYVKHPWAPSYSIVYETLKNKYHRGDAIFAQNVKTYYLDPEKLAGNLYHKVPGRKEYTMEQFKNDIQVAQRGWFMWDKHKVYHWREDVITYIYQHFKPYHGGPIDDLGVELWYFNEEMIK
ncbi:MAG: glycosyltransferase family 39 protein [Saprospiraceae bacterium]